MTARPLDGVRVVSLAEQYPGPLATFQLAELGAEVIQLERPGVGDPQRSLNPDLFRAAGLNKRSVALDLKDPVSWRAARTLIGASDVLVEGFRPGVMDRLELGYADLREDLPALVYCSISGYGQTGPNRDVVGHNLNYEATVGALDPFVGGASDARYSTASLPLGDIMAGMTAALGIVAAVHGASRTGAGTYLDIAIADSLLLALAPQLARATTGAEVWTSREAGWGVFACTEGHVALGIGHEDHFWHALCDALGLGEHRDLDHGQRVARAEPVRAEIAAVLATRDADHWCTTLGRLGVPCSRARRLHEVPDAPDVLARRMVVEAEDARGTRYRAVRSPLTRPHDGEMSYRIEDLGASTAAVLHEVGVPAADVEAILRR